VSGLSFRIERNIFQLRQCPGRRHGIVRHAGHGFHYPRITERDRKKYCNPTPLPPAVSELVWLAAAQLGIAIYSGSPSL
jgi:hypothetical protein